MREPSIHISISTFLNITKKLGIRVSKEKTEELFRVARDNSLDSRSLYIKGAKAEAIATKRTMGKIGDANMLANIIYFVRVKMKHIGVTKIKQTDPQWAQVKSLVPIVNQFCEKYELKYRDGYIQFVETGLKLMSKTKRANFNYCANWMSQKVDWIQNQYESIYLIEHDSDSEATLYLYNLYITTILEMTGISNNYKDNPTQYVNFIKARELADKVGVNYEVFIEAQFEALAFCNGIPPIEKLHGDKAEQNIAKYLASKGIRLVEAKSSKEEQELWASFK